MARVGRFGGRRRVNTANLTMLIASLMREQKQAEDRAAFDAWQNGGEFKGAKMTDDRILAYIKERRDGFSTDDPLWDQWNNQFVQTNFSIGEQKIGLAFKQGKASAGAVAAWYRKQLASIPKNSAFYRTVAGRAADWAKSAAASARGAGRARSYAAAKSKYERLKAEIASNDALIEAVTEEARRRGIVTGNDDLTEADATRLQQMFADGVTIGGKAITMDDWRDAAVGSYRTMGRAIAVYKALGWDTSGLRKDRRDYLGYIAKVNIIDERAAYEAARDQFEQDAADTGGDPNELEKLSDAYRRTLEGIYNGAVGRNEGLRKEDADFLGLVANEIETLRTGEAVGPTPFGDKDALTTAASVASNRENAVALQDGTAYWGQESFGGPMTVIPDPFRERDMDGGLQRFTIRRNGQVRNVYLRGQAIHTAVLIGPDGNAVSVDELTTDIASLMRQGYVPQETDTVAGYVFMEPGTGTRKYGVTQPNGSLLFTDDNPFSSPIIGTGDGAVVLGTFDAADGVDTKGIPLSVQAIAAPPANATRTASIGRLSPEEMRRALMKEVRAGDMDEVQAQETYDTFVNEQRGAPRAPSYTRRDNWRESMSQPTPSSMRSPASDVLAQSLEAIQQGLAPALNPTTPGAFTRRGPAPKIAPRLAPPPPPALGVPIKPPTRPPAAGRPRRTASRRTTTQPPSLAPSTTRTGGVDRGSLTGIKGPSEFG